MQALGAAAEEALLVVRLVRPIFLQLPMAALPVRGLVAQAVQETHRHRILLTCSR